MKATLILGLLLLAVSGNSFASAECQKYNVIEKVKMRSLLLNTSHDNLGESDEINLVLAASKNKLDENKLFSDFSGTKLYRQEAGGFYSRINTDVRFHTEKIVSDVEVNFEMIYDKYLNLVMSEKDIAVPLASGSVEVPFYVASGGNHDDLMFVKSFKIDLNSKNEQAILLQNSQGDQLELQIYSSSVSTMSKKELSAKIVEYTGMNNDLNAKIKAGNISMIQSMELREKMYPITNKLKYYQDLLNKTSASSCAR